MTMTDHDNAKGSFQPGPLGSPQPEPLSARAAVNEMLEAGLLDELMGRIDEGSLQLTGEGGFVPEMIRAVLERGLQAELSGHLGYDRGDPAGRGSKVAFRSLGVARSMSPTSVCSRFGVAPFLEFPDPCPARSCFS